MAGVLRKLRADLRGNRLQRLAILLLLTLAVAALTTSLTIQLRGGTAWEELFREANGAHAWFYGEEAAIEGIAARPEVQAVAGPYPFARVDVPGIATPNGRAFPMWIEGVGTAPPEIDRPEIVEGRWLRADGEVVLGRKFAKDNGYAPGDTITVTNEAGEHGLRVVGLAVFAGRSPFSVPALAWTTPGTLAGGLEPEAVALGVQLESRGQVRAFIDGLALDSVDERLFFVEDWNAVRAQNDEATEVIATFLGIFSLFALLSASFVIINAISSRVLARYRDIGLMKAVGFTPRQVAVGLLIEQLGMALIAVVGGLLIGRLLVPLLDDPASREFATDSLGYFRPGLALAIGGGVLALVTFATLVPAWARAASPRCRRLSAGPTAYPAGRPGSGALPQRLGSRPGRLWARRTRSTGPCVPG